MGLKENYEKKRNDVRCTLILFNIRNKIAIMYLFEQMKRIYNGKFLDEKNRKFYKKIFIKKIISDSKERQLREESFRLFKRYQYINIYKDTMKRFSVQFMRNVVKHDEIIEKRKKILLMKKGFQMILTQMKSKKILNKNLHNFYESNRKRFFILIKKRLAKKVSINKGLSNLSSSILKIYLQDCFKLLYSFYMKKVNFSNSIEEQFFKKIALKLILNKIAKNKLINNLNEKLKELKRKLLLKNYSIFISNLHHYQDYSKKKLKAFDYLHGKINRILLSSLKDYSLRNKNKKKKYINAIIFSEQNLRKKIFSSISLYKLYQQNKKNEYKLIEIKRNELITSHVIDKLIVKLSTEINRKEDFISNEFINKTSRGIRTALKWYRKLKTFTILKKANKLKASESNLELAQAKSLDSKSETSNALKAFKELKLLRNKKRAKPIILNFNNV